MAGAAPHGLVELDAYQALKQELISELERSLPVDGVYLSLHGAMEVEGIGMERAISTRAVRELVGESVPIVASLDLHGNIRPRIHRDDRPADRARTAPHRDGPETRRRALDHLVRCVRERIRPLSVMVKLPLLLPGELAVTESSRHGRSIRGCMMWRRYRGFWTHP